MLEEIEPYALFHRYPSSYRAKCSLQYDYLAINFAFYEEVLNF